MALFTRLNDSHDQTINKGQSTSTSIILNSEPQAHDWIIIALLAVIVLFLAYYFISQMCERQRSRLNRRFQSNQLLNRIAVAQNVQIPLNNGNDA